MKEFNKKEEKQCKKLSEQLFSVDANSYNRLEMLYELFERINIYPKVYWDLLGKIYIASDNTFEFKDEIVELFIAEYPHRDYLMSDQEIEDFKKLPDQLTIYRGMTVQELESGNFGYSWSLNQKVAGFFTNYKRNPKTQTLSQTIHSMTINKKDAIAYFSEREESEIIYVHKIPNHIEPRQYFDLSLFNDELEQ